MRNMKNTQRVIASISSYILANVSTKSVNDIRLSNCSLFLSESGLKISTNLTVFPLVDGLSASKRYRISTAGVFFQLGIFMKKYLFVPSDVSRI